MSSTITRILRTALPLSLGFLAGMVVIQFLIVSGYPQQPPTVAYIVPVHFLRQPSWNHFDTDRCLEFHEFIEPGYPPKPKAILGIGKSGSDHFQPEEGGRSTESILEVQNGIITFSNGITQSYHLEQSQGGTHLITTGRGPMEAGDYFQGDYCQWP